MHDTLPIILCEQGIDKQRSICLVEVQQICELHSVLSFVSLECHIKQYIQCFSFEFQHLLLTFVNTFTVLFK